MHVLLIGAGGFLGRHLAAALIAAGHTVTGTGRRGAPPPGHAVQHWRRLELTAADNAADWPALLDGVDAVVYAAGLLRERRRGEFDAIHGRAPIALAGAAAASAGIRRIVLISALGAGEAVDAGFLGSRVAAEKALLALTPGVGVVLRPSLVYGVDGRSTSWLRRLALLPLTPLPGDGRQPLQPLHVADLCAAVCRLLQPDAPVPPGGIIEAVGPAPLTLRAYLAALRHGLGLPAAPVLPVPVGLLRLAARWLAPWRAQPLCPETLKLLLRGNTGDPAALTALLDRPPRPVPAFAAGEHQSAERAESAAGLAAGLARAALALIWAAGGLASLLPGGRLAGFALLAQLGVHGPLAWLLLLGGAGLDLAFALLTLHPAAGRRLWAAQAAIVALYGAIAAVGLPGLLADPLGAIVKNLALLALLGQLALHAEPD